MFLFILKILIKCFNHQKAFVRNVSDLFCCFRIILYIIISLISTGSEKEFKYLTMLDLGQQSNIFSNVDDDTIAVELPSTLNIRKQNFSTLNVRFSHHLLWYNINLYFDIGKLEWIS